MLLLLCCRLGWAITYMILIIVVVLVIVLIAFAARFYRHSNMFIFGLLLFFYGMSLVTFAFCITPFFSKAQKAAALGSLSTVSESEGIKT